MSSTKDLEAMLGDPKKAIKAMMVPLIISYLVVQINTFADTSWCSGLGADASSAVSSISPIYWIVSGLGTGIGVGASTSIARHLGREEKDDADNVATQTIVLAIIAGLLITPLIYLFIDPMISWMNIGDIGSHCMDYIAPTVIFGTIIILNGALAGVIRSEGAAKKSMIVLLLAAILNMILDPIFIYGLNMGLSGAGYATVISTAISTLLGLYWYMHKDMYLNFIFRGFRIKVSIWKDVLFVGIPRVTESTLIAVLSLVQRVIIVPVAGVIGIAMYNIPWMYVAIAMVISQAAGSALIPVCSAALGRNDNEKAEVGFRYSLSVSMKIMVAFAAVVFIAADLFIMPFMSTESMMQYKSEFVYGLRVYALVIPFMCLIDIGSSMLQSMRMAQISMYASFARNAFLIMLMLFATSMEFIYWSLFVTEVLGGITMYWLARHEFRKYKRRRLLVTA